jgi:ribosome assembly protein RRB1
MSSLKRPRTPETDAGAGDVLKSGGRPASHHQNGDDPEFEDEFEDEYESEDEILEAGVDGRPDAEREAEEGVCHNSSLISWQIC